MKKNTFIILITLITICSSTTFSQTLKVNSIERQNPTDATTSADEVTFRVTFNDEVLNVSTDDFTLSGTASANGIISSIAKINDAVYDVKITGITNSSGTINLDIKGVDATGSNDIKKNSSALSISNTPTAQQTGSFEFGQSFVAENTGLLTKIILRKFPGIHTAIGTGTLKLFSGDGFGGNLLSTENITVTSDTGEVTYTFSNPASITTGNTYTFKLKYSGTGTSAFTAKTGNTYANGYLYNPDLLSSADLYFKIYVFTGGIVLLSNTLPTTDETYTISNLPTITTTSSNTITQTSAVLGGNAISNNGSSITERGIVYSFIDTTPEIGEANVTKDTNGTGTSVFSETINDFTGETTYYYRAYAINSSGTGYGEIKSFTTLGVSITAIERENPTLENTYENTVTYKVTFSKPVKDVDVSDFTTNAAGATISNINQISTTVYEVTINNVTTNGDVFLQIKGVNGVTGSNDITTLEVSGTTNITVNQTTTNDYLNQAKIGQTYSAGVNGILKKITFYPKDGNHTFSGTADLKIYSGDETNGGTEIHSESIYISNSTVASGQEFIVSSAVNVTQGNTYSVVLTNFSGSGNHALSSNTTNVYNDGHVIFTGMNDSSHLDFDLKIIIEEETIGFIGDMTLSTTAPTTNEKYIKLTPPTLPVVETTNATNVTSTSATLAGNITHQGASAVTERGILYSTTDTNPKIGDTDVTKDTNGTGTGVFSENITGLTANTIYYYRAYATNTQGTSYGDVKNFSLNNALNFDGTDDRVTIADNAAFDFSTGFTAEAWLNPDELSTQTYLSQYDTNQKAFAFILLASGRVEFTVTTDGTTDEYFESTATIAAGEWSHVALTFDGATMKAYINGVATGTNAVAGTMFDSTAPIEIGARNNAHFFNGSIDEVRIWSRVLTATEINNQKDKSVPANANGLAAYYKMNQGIAEGDNSSISLLTDSGSNNLNGTLNNFTKTGATSNFVAGATGNFSNTTITTNTFTTTGDWSTPSNWGLGIVPTQVDKVTINSGKTVTIDVDDLKIDDFTLENTAVLNIPKDKEIIIQNSFNSSGTLELSSDKTNSGVLLVEGTSTGTVTYKRGGLLANKWSIVTPPVAGQKIKAFAENVANNIRKRTDVTPNKYAISYYDDSQPNGQKWVYYFADMDENLEFEVGKSYAISRATDGEISFTGTLTTNTTTKTVTTNQWNAIGNPFTTYFPANKNSSNSFLNDNLTALDDTYQSIYVWDNTQNKYVVVSEVDDANRSLTPGQGFFVKLKNGQTEITFNEEKRSTKPATGNNFFGKTKNTTPTINVLVSDGNHTVNTAIKYFDNATVGFDKGYDIGNFNSDDLDVFTRLVDGNHKTNFTIQSLPKDNYENMVIPIGINAKANSEITFTLTKESIPNTYKIFLEDKVLNTFKRLDEENASYKITVSEDLNTTERFSVHVTTQVLAVEKLHQNNLNVYLSNKRTLNITGLNNQKATIKIISILGKELLNKTTHNTTLQISNDLKPGIYIVKIASDNGNIIKKIILE